MQYRNQQLIKLNGRVSCLRNGNRIMELTTKEGFETLDTVSTTTYCLSKFVQKVSNAPGERYPSR